MRVITFTFLFAVITCIIGCNNKKSSNPKKVFRYNEDGGITSLDPAFARTQANTWAVNMLFNGLVQLDDSLQIKPCLAKYWKISDDGLKYSFTLRNDVYFHSNPAFAERVLTPEDVAYSFRRLVDKTTASPGAWVFKSVMVDAYGNYTGFRVENDSVFSITLSKPYPPLLSLLTNAYCCIVPHEAIEHFGKDFRKFPCGTGPFVFKTWEEGVKLVLHKNHRYFEKSASGNALPYLDAVVVSFIDNKLSALLSFIKGELDCFNGLESSYKDEILNKDGSLKAKFRNRVVLQSNPFLNTEYLGFFIDSNQMKGKSNPVMNPMFRRAVNLGINRNEIVAYLRNNIGNPANNGFVSLGISGYNYSEVKGYTYNPDSALKLLAAAGMALSTPVELPLITTAAYQDIAILIQNQLSRIGIKVLIEINQASFNRNLINKGQASFYRASWVADYPDPENFLALFYSKNFSPAGPNYSHFSMPEFDRLYELSMETTSQTNRMKLFAQMDKMIIEHSPVVPLFYDKTFRLIDKKVHGLKGNAMNLFNLKEVDIN